MANDMNRYVSKGRKPFWKLLFPYSCLGLALYCIYSMIKGVSLAAEDDELIGPIAIWMTGVLLLTLTGIFFGSVRDFHLDFKEKRYKLVTRVGFFGVGKWRRFKHLNYVSVWQNTSMYYQVDLWYNNHHHFFINDFLNREDAFEVGEELANNLKIEFYNGVDVLDYRVIDLKLDDEVEISKEQRRVDLEICHGKRPIWRSVIAGILLIVAVFFFYILIDSIEINNGRKYIELIWFGPGILTFLGGLGFAVVSDYQFDFENNQFKHIYRVGPFRYGAWEPFESVDYVSVYSDDKLLFTVNLWFNGNYKIQVAQYKDLSLAMGSAKNFAAKLKIRVWDASDPHHAKWGS